MARMNIGYNRPLYLLPFDHRHSYVTGLFELTPPLTADEHDAVADSKRVIYDGFQRALGNGVPTPCAGILVDEEFGAGILRDARRRGYVTALATETSGSDEYEFEYGTAFADHIEAFDPTFAKALVRCNPEGDADRNRRQTARLKRLSDYCRAAGRLFMFELLVPATTAQLARAREGAQAFDLHIRPGLMLEAIRNRQDAGVEPDVWKIEGLDRREDCERAVEAARRGGRRGVGCIVLGRGGDERTVARWLETAASVPGFIGFAVGRTTFWGAVAAYEAKNASRQEAASRIAERYREWAAIFERAYPSCATVHQGDVAGTTIDLSCLWRATMARPEPLRAGDLIPGFELGSGNRPGRIGPWDYKQRAGLVVLVLHGASCARCRALLTSTADLYGEIRVMEAEVLAVMHDDAEAVRRLATELRTPFPLLADDAGAVRSAYLADGVGLFVAGRYNALFKSWTADEADGLPGATELREWLAFIDIQCEECNPPEERWGPGP